MLARRHSPSLSWYSTRIFRLLDLASGQEKLAPWASSLSEAVSQNAALTITTAARHTTATMMNFITTLSSKIEGDLESYGFAKRRSLDSPQQTRFPADLRSRLLGRSTAARVPIIRVAESPQYFAQLSKKDVTRPSSTIISECGQ